MYFWLTIIGLILLLLVYPIRVHLYSSEGVKAHVVLLGFIRIRINLKRYYRKLVGRESKEPKQIDDDFSIMEVLENYKKILSARPLLKDMTAKTNVLEFNWYTSVPMNNPIIGLALLPIYTSAQTVVIDIFYNYFNKVKEYDIDTKYNYLTDDILVYFNCIVGINLLKIMVVSVKYIKKWPLLLKRTT